MTGVRLRTVQVGPLGWGLMLLGGAVFGLGLARLTGWPATGGILVGIALIVAFVWWLDRRAFRRATLVIKVERSMADLQKLADRLVGKGLRVAVSREPRGIACPGRIHRKVVAAIEDDAADRRHR